jgi:hypothetical protein
MLKSRIQNKYSSLGRLVFALAFLGYLQLGAETPFGELKSKFDHALEENARKVASDQKIATTGKLYLDRLTDLKIKFINQGSLDGVLEVQDEIKRFENSGGIPDEFSPIEELAHFQRIYAREIRKVESEEMVGVLHYFKVYDDALLKREEELVRIGFIDKAVDVRKERNRVEKVLRKLSQRQADPMTIKYLASHREQGANNGVFGEDVFSRPGDSETAVPTSDNQEVQRDEENLSNENFDTLKAEFNRVIAVHWEQVASDEQKMYKEYMNELRIRKFHYQSQGSLDGVLALQAEMKRLLDTGVILNSDTELKHLEIVQKKFAQDLKKLKLADRERLLTIYHKYLNDMGELVRSLVKQQLIDEAIVVRKERERVAKVITDWAYKDLVLSVLETSQKD